MLQQADNIVMWRCRHCKNLVKQVKFSKNKWPLCLSCHTHAYNKGLIMRATKS